MHPFTQSASPFSWRGTFEQQFVHTNYEYGRAQNQQINTWLRAIHKQADKSTKCLSNKVLLKTKCSHIWKRRLSDSPQLWHRHYWQTNEATSIVVSKLLPARKRSIPCISVDYWMTAAASSIYSRKFCLFSHDLFGRWISQNIDFLRWYCAEETHKPIPLNHFQFHVQTIERKKVLND